MLITVSCSDFLRLVFAMIVNINLKMDIIDAAWQHVKLMLDFISKEGHIEVLESLDRPMVVQYVNMI